MEISQYSWATVQPQTQVDALAAVSGTAATGRAQAGSVAAPKSSFEMIAQQYNLHAMTQDEIEQMSSELYEAGYISLKDHTLLSFDAEGAAQYLQEQGLAGDGASIDGVSYANVDGERDIISEWSKKIAYREQQGQDAEDTKRILGLLQRLDSTRVFGASGITV
jgi:hypothetical protein